MLKTVRKKQNESGENKSLDTAHFTGADLIYFR
jgi:hypothetical protein